LNVTDLLFDATKLSEIFQTAKRCNDFVYNALLYFLKKSCGFKVIFRLYKFRDFAFGKLNKRGQFVFQTGRKVINKRFRLLQCGASAIGSEFPCE
jgi:hypothetical protein